MDGISNKGRSIMGRRRFGGGNFMDEGSGRILAAGLAEGAMVHVVRWALL